jgi:outer membrane protein TolC
MLLLIVAWPNCLLSQEISLDEAIRIALAQSAELKITKADLKAQQNKHLSSWLDLGPRFSATYDHIFYDDVLKYSLGDRDIVMRDKKTQEFALRATQPIISLFTLIQKARIEHKQKSNKENIFKSSKSQLAFRVAELYVQTQQQEALLEIAKASVRSSLVQKKDGEALQRADRIHHGDMLKLALALSQSEDALNKAQVARNMAYFHFKELLGLSYEEDLSLPTLKHDEDLEKLLTFDEALQIALQQRHEIKEALLEGDIQRIGKSVGFLQLMPELNVFAQINYNFARPALGHAQSSKILGINCKWDFFNNGAQFFLAREASVLATKSLYKLEIVKKNIRSEVKQALELLKAAQESITLAHKVHEQASEAYRIEKMQFSVGRYLAAHLVLAENAKTQAHNNVIKVLLDLKIQKLKLQQALGEQAPSL